MSFSESGGLCAENSDHDSETKQNVNRFFALFFLAIDDSVMTDLLYKYGSQNLLRVCQYYQALAQPLDGRLPALTSCGWLLNWSFCYYGINKINISMVIDHRYPKVDVTPG